MRERHIQLYEASGNRDNQVATLPPSPRDMSTTTRLGAAGPSRPRRRAHAVSHGSGLATHANEVVARRLAQQTLLGFGNATGRNPASAAAHFSSTLYNLTLPSMALNRATLDSAHNVFDVRCKYCERVVCHKAMQAILLGGSVYKLSTDHPKDAYVPGTDES